MMNDIAKKGYSIGRKLKSKGLGDKARKMMFRVCEEGSSDDDKMKCALMLSSMAEESVPMEIIESQENRNIILFFFGVTDGILDPFNKIVTVTEAAKLVGKDTSNINRAISSGKLVEGVDCKKSGSTWLIDKESLLRVFSKE